MASGALGESLLDERVANILKVLIRLPVFVTLAFAVSVGADRAAPAIGIPAAVVLLSYLAWAIGGIWPDVKFLADWSPTIAADALFDNLNDGDDSNDPFILSVRSPEHYALGHVAGAYNIPWKEVANTDHLAMLPTDQQIVAYCYTGHTGQVAATTLGLLGYDVTNLKFGMMGWTDDDEVLVEGS